MGMLEKVTSGRVHKPSRVRPDTAARNTARACPTIAAHQAEYGVWHGIANRCYAKSKDSAKYHARGIENRYSSFREFLNDVGPRPTPEHQIDRMDNDGHYEPGNCRWATRSENCRNRRSTRMIAAFGEELSLAAWSARTGIGRVLITHRIAAGWKIEEALTSRPSRSANSKHARKKAVHG